MDVKSQIEIHASFAAAAIKGKWARKVGFDDLADARNEDHGAMDAPYDALVGFDNLRGCLSGAAGHATP
jgi:hypothetical protein